MDHHYTYRVEWSPEDREYVGLVAEFPSLSWLEESPVDAMAGIVKMVADVIEDMAASGEPIPEPLGDRRYSGKIALRTSPEQHRKLTMAAAEQGVSVNQLLNQKIAAIDVKISVMGGPSADSAFAGPAVIEPPMSIMPIPEKASPEVAEQLTDIWRVLRNAFVHGAAVPGDRFLPGGLAPTGAQVMPDGRVIVFGERDGECHYPSYYVPNVVAKERRSMR